jgi:DNA-directed RNA polymerase specialized sigma24 family protein
MDDIDQHLEHLAMRAQAHPPGSLERQLSLSRLLGVLSQSSPIARFVQKSRQNRTGEIYDEALQRLYVHICDRIDSFDPQRSTVIHWALFLLNHRFINEAKRTLTPLTAPQTRGVIAQRLTLEDLDQCSAEPEAPLPSEELKAYLAADTDGSLRACCVEGHPTMTFHALVMQRLDGYSWKEISHQSGIPIPTLSSFYRRRLKQFAPQFSAYLSL